MILRICDDCEMGDHDGCRSESCDCSHALVDELDGGTPALTRYRSAKGPMTTQHRTSPWDGQ